MWPLLLLGYLLLRSDPLGPVVLAWSARHGVPPALVRAIIEVESGGRPLLRWEERVNDWACGPMQVRLMTARWLGFRGDPVELAEPVNSIRYGTLYLRYQLDRYGWDYIKAISAYNAGSYTPSNMDYVERVLRAWR